MSVYRDTNGTAGLPVANLWASLVDAGRRIPYSGARNITMPKRAAGDLDNSVLPFYLSFPSEHLMLCSESGEPVTDADRTSCERTFTERRGSRIVTERALFPQFDSWSFSFTASISPGETMPMSKIRYLFDLAGRSIGLGRFRPSMGGTCGRFEIAEWQVEVVSNACAA